MLGFLFQWLGRVDDAILMFDKAIQLNPQYTLAYLHKGKTFLHLADSLNILGRFEESLIINDKSIEINPNYH